MQGNQSQRSQLLNLTTLRFLAAFSVFLHHLDAFGLHPSRSLWGLNLSWTVSFFFVLSGFVLAYSYSDRMTDRRFVGRYLLQRAARLWPVHLACLLLLGALIGFGDVSVLQIYLAITLQNAWLPAYGSGFALNSVSWSISVELFFYALFPLLIRLSSRRLMGLFAANVGLVGGIILFISAAGISGRPDPAADPFWYKSMVPTGNAILLFFPPVRLIEFVAGILTYRAFTVFRLTGKSVWIAQAASAVVLLGYMTQHNSVIQFIDANMSSAAAQAYRQFGAFPLFALTVFVFSHQSGPISRVLSLRPLVFLGEISFAFYMVHQIVLRFLAQHWTLLGLSDRLAAASLAFVLSLALATALFYCVEKPTLSWIKSVRHRGVRRSTRTKVSPVQALG